MEKVNFACSKAKLCIFAAISTVFGISIFFVLNYTTGGNNSGLLVITAFLGGFALFSLLAGSMYFSLFKQTRGLVESFRADPLDTPDKEGQPLSIIMADLYHFKEINSIYGKVVGEHIMSVFTQAVLNCVRQLDIVARHSVSELIIILPHTDADVAKSIAEEIRTEVANAYVPPINGVVVSSINCKIDVSSYSTFNDKPNHILTGTKQQDDSFSTSR